ncbi:MAG: SDR family NAD(P)-dependent oxidoreductase [Vulcanimicrobiaceae bacterium]
MTSVLLTDDVIVLAGSTGKVGGETLRTFVSEGARVVVLSRSLESAQRAVTEYVAPENRERVVPFAVNLAEPAQARAAVDEAVSRFGRLDAVVSLSGHRVFVPIVDSSLDDLRENLEGNLIGNYNLMLAALRVMLGQPQRGQQSSRGRLVAVSAGSSKDPQPRFGLFGASKAALNVLMQAIAREHKADGIVANSVVLGTVATDAAKSYLDAEGFAAAATPQEVADTLAFLASARASGINGALVDLNAREVD